MSQTEGVEEPWSSLQLNPDGTPALLFQELASQEENDDDREGNPGKAAADEGPKPPFWSL